MDRTYEVLRPGTKESVDSRITAPSPQAAAEAWVKAHPQWELCSAERAEHLLVLGIPKIQGWTFYICGQGAYAHLAEDPLWLSINRNLPRRVTNSLLGLKSTSFQQIANRGQRQLRARGLGWVGMTELARELAREGLIPSADHWLRADTREDPHLLIRQRAIQPQTKLECSVCKDTAPGVSLAGILVCKRCLNRAIKVVPR